MVPTGDDFATLKAIPTKFASTHESCKYSREAQDLSRAKANVLLLEKAFRDYDEWLTLEKRLFASSAHSLSDVEQRQKLRSQLSVLKGQLSDERRLSMGLRTALDQQKKKSHGMSQTYHEEITYYIWLFVLVFITSPIIFAFRLVHQ